MTTQRITVACGQILCRVGSIEHNLNQIAEMAAQAASRGARLMLCAEGAITGYLLSEEVLEHAPTADGAVAERLRQISREHGLTIVTGTLSRDAEGRRVTAFIARPDGELLVQHKHMLTAKELAAQVVAGDEERILFEVDGVRFATCICADGGIENLHNKLAAKGVQVYLAPTAGGAGREFMRSAEELDTQAGMERYLESMEKVCYMGHAMRQCREHRMALVCCNLAGDDGVSNYHPGHSTIIDAQGRQMALIPGEYVREWLRPQLICEEIVVETPRQVG